MVLPSTGRSPGERTGPAQFAITPAASARTTGRRATHPRRPEAIPGGLVCPERAASKPYAEDAENAEFAEKRAPRRSAAPRSEVRADLGRSVVSPTKLRAFRG